MPQNLKLTKPACVRVNGYFYTLDSSNDTLFKKVDSGENAFSYPLNQDLTNECLAIQYDGNYFYTLECVTTGSGLILIKQWKIEDYILKLIRAYTLTGSTSQKYNCSAFAIEAFSRTLGSIAGAGDSIITLNSNARVEVGDILNLGPSTFTGDTGKTEQVSVLGLLPGNQVQLASTLSHSYLVGNSVKWSSRCWFFNKFQPSDIDPINGSGQLYSFDLNPLLTTVTPRKAGNEFRNILAATFLFDTDYVGGGRDFLAYMIQSNLLFIETDPISSNYLLTVESAAQNNQEVNANIIPVYAITYEGYTLFRLQHKATYRTGSTSSTEDWSALYNYQVSTLKRIPQSISVTATNAVIAADGVSTSPIVAIVKDQFDSPLNGRTVTFSDDDTGTGSGSCAPTTAGTNINGIANTTYTAGNTAKTITITADVT